MSAKTHSECSGRSPRRRRARYRDQARGFCCGRTTSVPPPPPCVETGGNSLSRHFPRRYRNYPGARRGRVRYSLHPVQATRIRTGYQRFPRALDVDTAQRRCQGGEPNGSLRPVDPGTHMPSESRRDSLRTITLRRSPTRVRTRHRWWVDRPRITLAESRIRQHRKTSCHRPQRLQRLSSSHDRIRLACPMRRPVSTGRWSRLHSELRPST